MTPLTPTEVASIIGVSPWKVRQLIQGGRLAFFTLPNTPDDKRPRKYINPDVLLAYAKTSGLSKETIDKIDSLVPRSQAQ